MKHVIAYIKPHKLSAVILALHEVEGLTGMSTLDVQGFGRGREEQGQSSIEAQLYSLIPHVKIEIFCADGLLEEIISTIQSRAHTGLLGDGKIYVTNAYDAIRISSGERGEDAV